MTEMIIDSGVVIDDVESVLFGIRKFSGRQVSSLDVVRKFIIREKNTRFFFDRRLNSYMQKQPDCIYAWLDTGFTDCHGNPILISLLQGFDGFCGHLVGTIGSLSDNIKSFYKLNHSLASQKTESFKRKYDIKAGERRIRHILDEQSYLLDSLHQYDMTTTLGVKLAELGLVFDDQKEGLECEPETAEKMEKDQPVDRGFTRFEEEITVSLLMEQMESMQAYMDELLHELEKVSTESSAKIDELQKKNDEYRRAMVQMREYAGCTEDGKPDDQVNPDNMPGHDLLGTHGKILVIGGQELGTNIMHGIAKTMGFEKKDFEFVEYDKTKDFADRIRKNGRYSAIIFGACPHKTTAGSGYSSALTKLEQTEDMPFTVDARSKSGKLKVTKESFREALWDICENLRLGYAC